MDASVTAISSAHLNRLRCKKERFFETGQKQRIGPLIARKLYLEYSKVENLLCVYEHSLIALQLMFR